MVGAVTLLVGLLVGSFLLWDAAAVPNRPFFLFFLTVVPAAAIGALFFGWRAGLFATAIVGALGWYLILPLESSFVLADQAAIYCLVAVLCTSSLLSFILGSDLSGRRNDDN